jgi:hypothetical protein
MVKILPSPGRISPEAYCAGAEGNRDFAVMIAVKYKSCVLGKFADDRKSTNPQVRRF